MLIHILDNIWWYLFGFIGLTVIAAKIPGVEHFVRPIVELIFQVISAVAKYGSLWSIWFIKYMIDAHSAVFSHIVNSKSAFIADPNWNENDD